MLAIRAEDVAADDEYAAILRCTGLDDGQLQRIRMEQSPPGSVDLDQWSGIIPGGGPFQASDHEEIKSATQRRVEAELAACWTTLWSGFPFPGCGYGIGTLGRHQGAVVDRTYAEPIGGVRIKLTRAGQEDPLRTCRIVLRRVLRPQGGDQQAAGTCSDAGVLERCPVQAFRIGRRVYATQFHPELDLDGLATRIEVQVRRLLKPEQADAVLAAARASGVTEVPNILEGLVELFAQQR